MVNESLQIDDKLHEAGPSQSGSQKETEKYNFSVLNWSIQEYKY